jgi:competence protein ComEA
MEVSMKRFLQRLSFSLTLFSSLFFSLLAGSFALPSLVYAAEMPAKTAKASKQVSEEKQSIQQQSVNINKADIALLTTLKGVGEKKAQAIIAYRNEHGPFQSIEELAEVKGIGEAIVNANREIISLN